MSENGELYDNFNGLVEEFDDHWNKAMIYYPEIYQDLQKHGKLESAKQMAAYVFKLAREA